MDGLAGRLGLGALFAAALVSGSKAADTNEFSGQTLKIELNGWMVAGEADGGIVALYRSPVTSTAQGYRRIWERWEYPMPMTDGGARYRSDMQFVENDCGQRRMRSLQRNAFTGNNLGESVAWSSQSGSGWQFVPPGSMADTLMNIACSGQTKPGSTINFVQPQPVSDTQIHRAVITFHETLNGQGLIGVKAASAACYDSLRKELTWLKLDYCIVFDEAAGRVDAGMSALLKAPPDAYFTTPTRLARAVPFLDRLTNDVAAKRNRLKALSDKGVGELAASFGVAAK